MPAELHEIKERLRAILHRVHELEDAVRIDAQRARLEELEGRMSQPGFWDNPDEAQEVIADLKRIRGEVEPLDEIRQKASDDLELSEMASSEGDQGSLDEIWTSLDDLEAKLDRAEMLTVLSGKHDASSAYVGIHAGAGGTESCDWAEMLARMYQRFAERQGFKVSVVDLGEGEEAGIKNVTFLVKGEYAYGYMRSEVGVHRLVRKSPFDAKNRRHTSFAAVSLIPEIEAADKDIDIPASDLRIDTYRAGGAGGQHVNTTDSAVRITHLPTGIVVQCQNERSQHANRATAMKMLHAKLVLEEERKREEELQQAYGEKGEIAWGNQIRNYVMDPYTLVKDRRTGHEEGNVESVLDGDIFPFIEAWLRFKRQAAAG